MNKEVFECVLLADLNLPHASYYRPPIRFRNRDGFLGCGPASVPLTLGEIAALKLDVRVNGQLRPVFAKDESVAVTVVTAEKADKNVPGQVAAPFSGTVTQKLAVGDTVEAGQPVATIEAMKMEAAITAPVNGRVARLAFEGARGVESGDLVLFIEETPAA